MVRRTHHFGCRRRRGFTLVELLVVIGIIALLIGILLPALNAARRSANAATCLSNLHQLILAVNVYAANNKNYMVYDPYPNGNPNYVSPAGVRPTATDLANSSGIPWLDALAPYIAGNSTGQAAAMYNFCPEAPLAAGNYVSANYMGTANAPYHQLANGTNTVGFAGSYGMNLSATSGNPYWSYLVAGTGDPANPFNLPATVTRYFWTRLSDSPNDNVPVVFDCVWCDVVGSTLYTPLTAAATAVIPAPSSFITGSTNDIQRACLNRHRGSVNVAFKDGSATNVRLKALWDLRWNRSSVPESAKLPASPTFPSS